MVVVVVGVVIISSLITCEKIVGILNSSSQHANNCQPNEKEQHDRSKQELPIVNWFTGAACHYNPL